MPIRIPSLYGKGRIYLTEDEREEIIKIIEEETGYRPDQIFTYDELYEYFEEMLKDEGIPERLLYYIDIEKMIEDEINGGTLSSITVELDGEEIEVYYFT